MPIDGCPKSKIKRGIQLFYAMQFSLFNVQRLPVNKGKAIRIMAGALYKVIGSKNLRYKLWKNAEKHMSKYKWEESDEATELIGSIKGMMLRHPKEDFDNVIYVDFEEHKVPVMKGYDRYLKLIWGNYMELPPVEQRTAKHDAVFIDLENSYVKYKGKYYCKKQ